MNHPIGNLGCLPAEIRQQIFAYVLVDEEFEVCVDENDCFTLKCPKPVSFATLQVCRALRHENTTLQNTVPTLVFRYPEHLRKYSSGQLKPASLLQVGPLPEPLRLRSARLLFLHPLHSDHCFDQTGKTRYDRERDSQEQNRCFATLRHDWHRAFKVIPSSIRHVQFDCTCGDYFKVRDMHMVGQFVGLLSTVAYLRSERRARSSIVGCRQEFEHKKLEAFIPLRLRDADRAYPFKPTNQGAVPQATMR